MDLPHVLSLGKKIRQKICAVKNVLTSKNFEGSHNLEGLILVDLAHVLSVGRVEGENANLTRNRNTYGINVWFLIGNLHKAITRD